MEGKLFYIKCKKKRYNNENGGRKMKRRKITALLMASAMALTAFGGTGLSALADEPYTVKISFPSLVYQPSEEGVQQVEEALNAYLEEQGENVRIDLDPIDGNNYMTQVDMALMGGEKIDIYLPLDGLGKAVSSNKVISLNDYLDNELKETVDTIGENYLRPSTYNDNVYGIQTYRGNVMIYYWICDKELFDATGFSADDIKNIRDLTPVLAKLKEQNENIVPIAPSLGANNTPNSFNQLAILSARDDYEDVLIGSLNPLTCIEKDDLTIKNIYETDMFKEACELAYEWNQNGYVLPDASVATDAPYDLIKAGRAASMTIGYAYGTESVDEIMDAQCGKDIVAIPLCETLLTPVTMYWSITQTCSNPEAAVKVLNMMFTNETVLNYIIFGVEGIDYVKGDVVDGIQTIKYPEGYDMSSVAYTEAYSCGIVGNQFIMYALEGNTKAEDIAFMKEKTETAKLSPIYGFDPDTTNVKTEQSAIGNVVSQYASGLLTGELDPEEYIPKMQEEMKDAGMDNFIAEVQTQLDAWEK